MINNFEKAFAPVLNGVRIGNNTEIQVCCPFHRDRKPSMSINVDTGLWNCFGCNAHGDLVGFVMQYNNLDFKGAMKFLGEELKPQYNNITFFPKVEKKKEITDYSDYCYKVWNDTIMHDEFYEFYCKKLYELRGITLPTAVACMIGYDPQKGWIFPCVRYEDDKVVGYEIRHKLFQKFDFNNSKCYKAKNTPSCLCTVYRAWDNKKAIVCEGFIDSYKMYQYQEEKVIKNHGEFAQVDCTILTPSCGVKTLPEIVEELKLWNDFDEIIFCVDNDAAGNEAKEKLIELPHENKFKFFNGLAEGEDFENLYERKLKGEIYGKVC